MVFHQLSGDMEIHSSIINTEQIYVLKDGWLAEQGTHNDLMEQKGEYYSLYVNDEEKQE